MGSHRKNPCCDHLLKGPTQGLLGLHLETGHSKELGQVVHGQRNVHIIFEPVETYTHENRRSALQMLEYWSNGVLEYRVCLFLFLPITPVLHLLELSQEPHVVPVEKLNVIDSVLEHGHPLDSHAKGKTGIHFRVIVHELINFRIIHP
jgi:hypothetical protein